MLEVVVVVACDEYAPDGLPFPLPLYVLCMLLALREPNERLL